MNQADRDGLVALKKAEDGKMTQRQAAEELKIGERQVRRLLATLRKVGDKAVIHGLRGRSGVRANVGLGVFGQEARHRGEPGNGAEVDEGGRTVAGTQAASDRSSPLARATGTIRRTGAMDTSTHEWLEGRGERIYRIKMIDDATSRLLARFVRSDSTAENMAVLEACLQRFGRPLEFYTDQASHFVTTPKKNHPARGEPLPPVEKGQLRIDEAVKEVERGNRRIGETKTSSSCAYVGISKGLQEELEIWIYARRQQRPYHGSVSAASSDLLFPNEAGTTFRLGNYLKAKDAGIMDMTYQALRRTCATHFRKHGRPRDIQAQLRHWRIEMTGRYVKEIPDQVRAAVENMDRERCDGTEREGTVQ